MAEEGGGNISAKGEAAGGKEKTLKYPHGIYFILGSEFCERLYFYGLISVLSQFFRDELKFTRGQNMTVFHTFVCLCNFASLLGGCLADAFLGQYHTMLYLTIVYVGGSLVVVISALGFMEGAAQIAVAMIGVFVIGIAVGGLKPCVICFGGDQYVVPQQFKELQTYFAIFYLTINAGVLISYPLTPIIRREIQCFGKIYCDAAAFGILAIFMVISLGVILVGRYYYVIHKPSCNMVKEIFRCMSYAISRRMSRGRKGESETSEPQAATRDHWLDWADNKFDQQLINDIKTALRVLIIFCPMPFLWAQFEQQGVRWTNQAAMMNGNMGSFSIPPKMMKVTNAILVVLLIPLFEYVLYPVGAKIGFLVQPLDRMVVGGVFATLGFVASGILELELKTTYADLPRNDKGHLIFINALGCEPINLQVGTSDPKDLEKKQMFMFKHLTAGENTAKLLSAECKINTTINVVVEKNKAYTYILTSENGSTEGHKIIKEDELQKLADGLPSFRFLYDRSACGTTVVIKEYTGPYPNEPSESELLGKNPEETPWYPLPVPIEWVYDEKYMGKEKNYTLSCEGNVFESTSYYHEIPPGKYLVSKESGKYIDFPVGSGGVYSILVTQDGIFVYPVTKPNSMNMMWLVPQYIILTFGEIMFSVTGLELAYTESPVGMKSLVTTMYLMGMAIAHVLVISIAETELFGKQYLYAEFFMFAALLALNVVILYLLVRRYKRQLKMIAGS